MARRAPMPQRIPDYDSVACLEALLLGNEGSMSGGGGLLTVVSESRRAEVRRCVCAMTPLISIFCICICICILISAPCAAAQVRFALDAVRRQVRSLSALVAEQAESTRCGSSSALRYSPHPPPPPRALKAVMAAAATAARRAAPAGGPASDTGEELSIPAISIPAAAAGGGGFDAPPPASSAPAAGARDAGARLGPIGSPTGEAWSSSSRRLGKAGASGPLSPIAPRPRTTDPAAGSRGAGSPEEGASGKDAAATDAAWVPWRADNAKSRVNVRKRAGGGTAGSMSPTHDA